MTTKYTSTRVKEVCTRDLNMQAIPKSKSLPALISIQMGIRLLLEIIIDSIFIVLTLREANGKKLFVSRFKIIIA